MLRISNQIVQNLLLFFAAVFMTIFVYTQWAGLRLLADFLWKALTSIPDFVQKIVDYFEAVPGDHLRSSLLVGALFGAVTTTLVIWLKYRNHPRWLLTGAGLGAIVGAIGGQILIYPTQHCTYVPEMAAAQYRLGLFVTCFSSLILLIPLWTLLTTWGQKRVYSTSGYFRGYGLPYLLLLPTVLILALFLYYPASQILTLSLRLKVFPLPQERFACLQNYVNLSEDQIYRNSFQTSLLITTLIVVCSLALSLAIAVLASNKVKGIGIYRTLLIWPYAISPVVTGVIFLSMFREGGAGLINWALDNTLGLQPSWLTDDQLAPAVIVAAAVWNILGFNILFYIAGLQNIPEDLLEAAALDGANSLQRFARITFPLLSPFTFFLLVTNITYSFYGIFGAIDTLTKGGPPLGPGGVDGGATNVLIYKMYEDAFTAGGAAGSAAAQAVILFLMIAVVTVLQFNVIERRVTYGG